MRPRVIPSKQHGLIVLVEVLARFMKVSTINQHALSMGRSVILLAEGPLDRPQRGTRRG